MRRRDVIAVLALSPLLGAAGPDKSKGAPAAQHVDVSPVALPIVSDGRLRNYVFVTVRVHLTPKADMQKLRLREPYFRDALVRLGHRVSFAVATDFTTIDKDKLRRAFLTEAQSVAGAPGLVRDVEITSATPRRRTGVN